MRTAADDLRQQVLSIEAMPLQRTKFGQFYETNGFEWCRPSYSFDLDERAFVRSDEARYACTRTIIPVAFARYTDAALACDLPEHALRRGDLVKIIDVHSAADGETGYSIEIFNALGETMAVTAVPELRESRGSSGLDLAESVRAVDPPTQSARRRYGDRLNAGRRLRHRETKRNQT